MVGVILWVIEGGPSPRPGPRPPDSAPLAEFIIFSALLAASDFSFQIHLNSAASGFFEHTLETVGAVCTMLA
jgi:hypothetical protein